MTIPRLCKKSPELIAAKINILFLLQNNIYLNFIFGTFGSITYIRQGYFQSLIQVTKRTSP